MSIRDDKGAAYKGMIFTATALFLLCFGIVKLTNRKFEGHKAEAAAEKKK